MMVDLDETQQQIAIAAERHFERQTANLPSGIDARRRAWREIAELGWISAVVPERLGGIGGPVAAAILAAKFALGSGGEPFLEAGILPAFFCASLSGDSDRASSLFDAIAAGEQIVVAVSEGCQPTALLAGRTDGGMLLSGRVDAVVGADIADRLLVFAQSDAGRVGLLVRPDAAGLKNRALPTIDDRWASTLIFENLFVKTDHIFDAEDAFGPAQDVAILGQCAQLMALLRRMMALTREHLLTRRQFGQPLASFQALRHRYADMFAECEQGDAILQLALKAAEQDVERNSRTVSACKLRVSQAARFVGAQAVQLHGAMAMTEEYELGRLYKRTLVLRKIWGDEDAHAARMMALPRQHAE